MSNSNIQDSEDMSLWLDYVRQHSKEHFGYFYVDNTNMLNNPPDWDKVTLLDFDWVEDALIEKLHSRVKRDDIPIYAIIGIRHVDGRDEFKTKKELLSEREGSGSMGSKQVNMNKTDKRKVMEKLREKGEKVLNEDNLNETISRASSKIEEERKKPDSKINELLDQIGDILSLLKDYVKGVYREVPVTTIVLFVGAVAYFVLPIDAIPDSIPGVGYIDDSTILNLVLVSFQADLLRYMEWKKNNPDASSKKGNKDDDIEHVSGEVCNGSEGIPIGALEWCRENAPTALKGCSDEELWNYMQDAYFKLR